MKFTDTAVLAGTRRTADGYLVADVLCARMGCQEYDGADLGLIDAGMVSVFRPESVVFSKDSMATFAGKPVTVGHPDEPVTSDNWKAHAVGDIGEEVARDGECIRVSIKVMDAAAIKAIESGTQQISMGYTTGIELKDGTAPDGTKYGAVQVGPIKINHLAIVDMARGGAKLRIGDGAGNSGINHRDSWGVSPIQDAQIKQEVKKMTDKVQTVVLGDKAATVAVDQAPIIEQFKTDQAKLLADAGTAHKAAMDTKDAELATKDAKIKTLEDAALSDADLDAKVQARSTLIDAAKTIAKDIDVSGMSDAEIRKAAVVAALDDKAVEGKPDAYIDAMFDIQVAEAKDAESADPLNKPKTSQSDGKTVSLDQIYQDRDRQLSDAWNHKKKEA